ncbi:Hypothetical predicted protein [Paramuricea clavata]|uniref:Uncharacterized protein n=1 Tax=Paramuricea clavata TaxID=317549 RepID=A0A7D9DKB6_PARCT|nr:Hypothetical predicted protein [Paramuricea clavata]
MLAKPSILSSTCLAPPSDQAGSIPVHIVYTPVARFNQCLLEIRKVLSKVAKEKDCKLLNEWIKPCENHLHWSATSTFSGNGLVIWAKFKSFLGHIVNKHSDHNDPLFNKCGHGSEIPAIKWLTKAYVQEVFETYTGSSKKVLKDAALKLKEMSPKPMDSMFEKQKKVEALKKRLDRRGMVILDVPPTTPVSQVLEQEKAQKKNEEHKEKANPCCRLCKNPMKGHKYVKDCPKNK